MKLLVWLHLIVSLTAVVSFNVGSSKLKGRRDTVETISLQHKSGSDRGSHTRRQSHQRHASLFASIVLGISVLMAPVQEANAGFGPSSGATTSPPPGLTKPKTLGDKDLEDKKLRILIGSSIDEKRLEEFSAQLDILIESLRTREDPPPLSFSDDSSSFSLRSGSSSENLEKAEVLRIQIQDRERLLGKLEAQPYWFNYFAAFVGSIASTLVMHPVDTIKVRQQLGSNGNITESGGILGLYRGLTGNIWKEGPPSALYLGVYETVKFSLIPTYSQNLLLVYLLSGAAGETVGSVVRAPAEAIKLLVQSSAVKSPADALKQVLGTKRGRGNIFRAWSSSLWRDVPFGAIQIAVFELVKTSILNNPDIQLDSSTLLSEAVIGAFAGGCGAFLTNPADVVTTRIIAQNVDVNSETGRSAPELLGVIGMARKIIAEEGIFSLLTGWQARVSYWAPAISIFLSCYCSVRQAGARYDWF